MFVFVRVRLCSIFSPKVRVRVLFAFMFVFDIVLWNRELPLTVFKYQKTVISRIMSNCQFEHIKVTGNPEKSWQIIVTKWSVFGAKWPLSPKIWSDYQNDRYFLKLQLFLTRTKNILADWKVCFCCHHSRLNGKVFDHGK